MGLKASAEPEIVVSGRNNNCFVCNKEKVLVFKLIPNYFIEDYRGLGPEYVPVCLPCMLITDLKLAVESRCADLKADEEDYRNFFWKKIRPTIKGIKERDVGYRIRAGTPPVVYTETTWKDKMMLTCVIEEDVYKEFANSKVSEEPTGYLKFSDLPDEDRSDIWSVIWNVACKDTTFISFINEVLEAERFEYINGRNLFAEFEGAMWSPKQLVRHLWSRFKSESRPKYKQVGEDLDLTCGYYNNRDVEEDRRPPKRTRTCGFKTNYVIKERKEIKILAHRENYKTVERVELDGAEIEDITEY
jgi:hypothetical protein